MTEKSSCATPHAEQHARLYCPRHFRARRACEARQNRLHCAHTHTTLRGPVPCLVRQAHSQSRGRLEEWANCMVNPWLSVLMFTILIMEWFLIIPPAPHPTRMIIWQGIRPNCAIGG